MRSATLETWQRTAVMLVIPTPLLALTAVETLKAVVLNLWVAIPQGSHIRYLLYNS